MSEKSGMRRQGRARDQGPKNMLGVPVWTYKESENSSFKPLLLGPSEYIFSG